MDAPKVRWWATALAFVAASLVPGALMMTRVLFDAGASPSELALGYAVTVAVSGAIILVVAVPSYLLLHALGLLRWWSAMAAGAMIGAGLAAAVFGYYQPTAWAIFTSMGAAAGTTFWLARARLARCALATDSA